MRIRTLIVDDEPWARKRLVSLFQAEPDCDVVGECADGESAVRAIVSTSPDLVCLDVRMPDMSGVDVLDAVVQIGKGPSDPCPSEWPLVMFVTAYDRYAVQAFERDAVDYLLKPFDDERFQQALARVRRDRVADGRAGAPLPQIVASAARRRVVRRFAVKTGGRIVFIRADDVSWLEATGNYVTMHAGAESHLIRDSMVNLEAKLDPSRFVRIHRSAIVNLDRVRELTPWDRGEQAVRLDDGTQLPIGRFNGSFENFEKITWLSNVPRYQGQHHNRLRSG